MVKILTKLSRVLCFVGFCIYFYYITSNYARYLTITKISFMHESKYPIVTICEKNNIDNNSRKPLNYIDH